MDVRAIIRATLFTPMRGGRWGLPVVFRAPPGTAKSSIIKEEAIRAGLKVEVLSPGMRGEGAFGVVPVPGEGNKELCYPPPEWVAKLGSRGVVFLDEINTAPPALQPPLLGLVLDGIIGAVTLPAGIRRIAAMNSVEDAAGGWDLPPALANRFGHIDWHAPDVERWSDWLLDDDEAKVEATGEDIEAQVMRRWPLAWARARGLVAGFVKTQPQMLHDQPKAGDPRLAGPWPSRRTWEFATRALASAEVHHLHKLDEDMLVSSFIGNSAATDLERYRSANELPDPAELLDGKVTWRHDGRRLDRTVAVLGSCSALIKPEDARNREARAETLWRILDDIMQDSPDITVPAATRLARAKLTKVKGASKVLARMQPVLEKAQYVARDFDNL